MKEALYTIINVFYDGNLVAIYLVEPRTPNIWLELYGTPTAHLNVEFTYQSVKLTHKELQEYFLYLENNCFKTKSITLLSLLMSKSVKIKKENLKTNIKI